MTEALTEWFKASQSYVQFYTASTKSSIFKYCSNVTHARFQQQSFFVFSELIKDVNKLPSQFVDSQLYE